MPEGKTGIEITVQMLARMAWRSRRNPKLYQLARRLTAPWKDRQDKMEALVQELHHRGDPIETDCLSLVLTMSDEGVPREGVDADDAAVFVAAAAMSVGIPCRIVGVRYGHAWTCRVDYEVGDHWESIDPLQQTAGRKPDEEITASLVFCDACDADCTADYLAGGGKTLCPPCAGQKPIWEPKKMDDGRHEEVLADGVRLEARSKTTYHVDKFVTLRADDPDHAGNVIEVTVTASVHSYKPEPEPPRIQFSPHMMLASRKQWEAVKRLADRAWDEYEKRFPQSK